MPQVYLPKALHDELVRTYADVSGFVEASIRWCHGRFKSGKTVLSEIYTRAPPKA